MEIEFEWDEDKRLRNIEKHDLDFQRVMEVFDDRPVISRESARDNEVRFISVGRLDEHYIAVIWTLRGDVIRIISARGARDGERKQYHQTFGERR